MKLTSSSLWLSMLLAACLSSCGSDFAASGVSTGGTGDRVPDLGEDDFSLPNDAETPIPNPPVAANQSTQLSLFATDAIWATPNWRLVQSDQELLILPDLRRTLPTQLGQKAEGILLGEQIAVLFGSDSQRSYYQILSVDNDGAPQLSAPVSMTGRIVQARLQPESGNDDTVLELLVEDYTGLTPDVGSYHLRSVIRAGVSVLPAERTRLATRPLASASNARAMAWIGANKGGTQWLYWIECTDLAVSCSVLPPIMLSGKLFGSPTLLRSDTPDLFIDDNRIYARLTNKNQSFLGVYTPQNGRLRTADQVLLQGTVTASAPPVTPNLLAAQSKAISSRLLLGGGGFLPPVAINSTTQAALQPTNTTWLSLRVNQSDQQLTFYPEGFAATPRHRIETRGKSEGLYTTQNLMVALHSDQQDTVTTLVATYNSSANALTASTSRAQGRVEQLRIQQNPTHTQIDELINQAKTSSVAAYFARSPVDPVTKTKGTASLRPLPYAVVASASSSHWMVWLGQDAEQNTWLHPVVCTPTATTCQHPEPVKLQGRLATDTQPLRQSHAALRIIQDRLFVYSQEANVRYLNVYAFEPSGLVLVKRTTI
jgi:hypothetical protein